MSNNNPVVIGGTGGSGTRVFALACIEAKYYMGANLNVSLDALDFVDFFNKWTNSFLQRNTISLSSEQVDSMKSEFHKCLSSFKENYYQSSNWGWKNPRNILLLPFFDTCFSGLKFIHIVRDGRDMAYSNNQNQLNKHGQALLSNDLADCSLPVRSINFWKKSNMDAALYGEKMGDRYLQLNLESLCYNTEETLNKLSDFLEAPILNMDELLHTIKAPNSLGRWRERSQTEQKMLKEHGKLALDYFGYDG